MGIQSRTWLGPSLAGEDAVGGDELATLKQRQIRTRSDTRCHDCIYCGLGCRIWLVHNHGHHTTILPLTNHVTPNTTSHHASHVSFVFPCTCTCACAYLPYFCISLLCNFFSLSFSLFLLLFFFVSWSLYVFLSITFSFFDHEGREVCDTERIDVSVTLLSQECHPVSGLIITISRVVADGHRGSPHRRTFHLRHSVRKTVNVSNFLSHGLQAIHSLYPDRESREPP